MSVNSLKQKLFFCLLHMFVSFVSAVSENGHSKERILVSGSIRIDE